MKKILNCFIFMIPILVNSQVPFQRLSVDDYMWMNVGNAGFSAGSADYISLRFSPAGEPYVAYADWGYGKNVTVMKYNGTGWVNVGSPGFSQEGADWTSLAFRPSDGQPYVAFSDQMDLTKKASVMKFDGTIWDYVGNASFSGSVAEYLSLAFSQTGEPYVAFCDAQYIKVSVMKFDGNNWIYIGAGGISDGMAHFTSLAFNPAGEPYVAYSDFANSWKATVLKFNGTIWENVGSKGFSTGRADFTSLAFSQAGQPYVAYVDGGNLNKVTVMKFNGTDWINVGNPGISAGEAFHTSLAFSPSDDQPCVAFADNGYSTKATLMKFDGTNWFTVGGAGFSQGMTVNTSLAFSPSGIPHVAYTDVSKYDKTTVMKYDSVGVGIDGPANPGLSVYPGPVVDKITIELSGVEIQGFLTITNLMGHELISRMINDSPTVFNISDLPAGIYILKINTRNSIITTRFCKN